MRRISKISYTDSYVPDIYDGDESVRYSLGNNGVKTLLCLGINPSIACIQYSDPTMNALINIANRKGFDSCIMINPAPYRASRPSELPQSLNKQQLIQLHHNYEVIDYLFKEHCNSTILCGWGSGAYTKYDWFIDSLIRILKMANKYKMRLVCFRINQNGQPTHLSYLRIKYNKQFCNGKGDSFLLSDYTITSDLMKLVKV